MSCLWLIVVFVLLYLNSLSAQSNHVKKVISSRNNVKQKSTSKNCKIGPLPLLFEEVVQYKIEYLRRFRWNVYSPQFNWFYDPLTSLTVENPCHIFKTTYSGIDVTLFAPDCPNPICSTLKQYNVLDGFRVKNCKNLKPDSFDIVSCGERVAYGLNLVSQCEEIRTVVLSKATDEFPIGYANTLINNPKLDKIIK